MVRAEIVRQSADTQQGSKNKTGSYKQNENEKIIQCAETIK